MRRLQTIALATALSFASLACSNGSGNLAGPVAGGSPATATVDILLSSSGNSALFSLASSITEVRLREETGDLTDNLLATSVDIELVRPGQDLAWIARTNFDEGRYNAVVLRFDSTAYDATANDGSIVSVQGVSDELVATLPVATDIDAANVERLEVSIDLGASLGTLAAGSIDFSPVGSTTMAAADSSTELQSRIGIVRARDLANQMLEVELFADQNLNASIGTINVRVPDGTLLVDTLDFIQNSVPFFFTYLTPGLSIIDVNGVLGPEGEVIATRIELEDQNGTVVLPHFPLKLRGRVEEQLSSTVFRVRVRDVLRGSSAVTTGSVLDVAIDTQVGLFFSDSVLGAASDIAPGLEVELKSRQLSTSPVFVRRVALGEIPPIVGEIVDTTSLPASVTVQLDPSQIALSPGQVLTNQTDVTLTLPAGGVFLATPVSIALDANEIRAGLGVEVRGAVSGPPSMPLLDATRVDVIPGTLVGAQVVAPASFGFTVEGGNVTTPFSETLGVGAPGPIQVEVTSETLFRGAASSQAELNAFLFAGDSVFVTVSGIESDLAGRVVGYDVLVQL